MNLSDQVRELLIKRYGGGRGEYAKLCRNAGVDHAILSRFICGKRSMRLATLDKLCEVCGWRLTFGGECDKVKENERRS